MSEWSGLNEASLFAKGLRPGPNFHRFYAAPVKLSSGPEALPIAVEPIPAWSTPSLHPAVVKNVERMGFEAPTPVQSYACNPILRGRDVVAISETGSGKSAALLAPLITRLLQDKASETEPRSERHVSAILILPARELAIQQFYEALKFAYGTELRVRLAYGGMNRHQQRIGLCRGADLLVATPGRLEEFLAKGWIDTDRLRYLAADEADMAITRAFLAAVEVGLLRRRPNLDGVQILFTTATFPASLREAVNSFLHPDFVTVQAGEDADSANVDVVQSAELCMHWGEKAWKLLRALRQDLRRHWATRDHQGFFTSRTIVFINRVNTLYGVMNLLHRKGIPAAAPVHGSLSQAEREWDLEDFRVGRVSVLVATDVVARGINIPHIDHVILFDLPSVEPDGLDFAMAQYIQRIGRSGRLGHPGRATAFFAPYEDPVEAKPNGDLPLRPRLLRVQQQSKNRVTPWLLLPIPGYG